MSAATNMICHDDDDTVDDTRYTDGDTWYTWWYDGDTDDENDDGYNEDLYIYIYEYKIWRYEIYIEHI